MRLHLTETLMAVVNGLVFVRPGLVANETAYSSSAITRLASTRFAGSSSAIPRRYSMNAWIRLDCGSEPLVADASARDSG
jgi:hypothetical protein